MASRAQLAHLAKALGRSLSIKRAMSGEAFGLATIGCAPSLCYRVTATQGSESGGFTFWKVQRLRIEGLIHVELRGFGHQLGEGGEQTPSAARLVVQEFEIRMKPNFRAYDVRRGGNQKYQWGIEIGYRQRRRSGKLAPDGVDIGRVLDVDWAFPTSKDKPPRLESKTEWKLACPRLYCQSRKRYVRDAGDKSHFFCLGGVGQSECGGIFPAVMSGN